jgi:hypothetical protein
LRRSERVVKYAERGWRRRASRRTDETVGKGRDSVLSWFRAKRLRPFSGALNACRCAPRFSRAPSRISPRSAPWIIYVKPRYVGRGTRFRWSDVLKERQPVEKQSRFRRWRMQSYHKYLMASA